MHEAETPREEARSWSPARAQDDDRGPRCGARNEDWRCELERGHDGPHSAALNPAGDRFIWSARPTGDR